MLARLIDENAIKGAKLTVIENTKRKYRCSDGLGGQRLRGLSSQVEEIKKISIMGNISRYLVISAIQRVSFDPASIAKMR